jgi:hypothetical protein
MKKIYKVTLTQGFNAHKRKETSSMDIFLNRTRYEKEICYHHVTGREKYIYTESEKQAKLLYEKRYPVSKIDSIINSFYGSWADYESMFFIFVRCRGYREYDFKWDEELFDSR